MAAHFVMHAQERVTVMAGQRQVVRSTSSRRTRRIRRAALDPDLLADWKAAEDDAAALRVIVDQVASLTDVRALALHQRWC